MEYKRKEKAKPIQQTIFDLFADIGPFTLKEATEATQSRRPNTAAPTIRARIYEGIEKGVFKRLERGVYSVTKKGSTCLMIQGDGRDLSFLADSSVSCIVTDHPYQLKSLKGGNRDFSKYECFRYTQEDFDEKARVLKDGCFLVEFLPEESADNYEYIYSIKEMARKAGFEYYAKVPWKKGDFIANTGRKSKNTEDILIFSKGDARKLRPDAKKDKAEPHIKHFMKGARGMLPTVFDFPKDKNPVHSAQKPVALLEAILEFLSLPGELVLDQFAGSGNLGIAAINKGRSCILIEKAKDTFLNLYDNVQRRLGEIENSAFEAV